jgi:hypothetical protein
MPRAGETGELHGDPPVVVQQVLGRDRHHVVPVPQQQADPPGKAEVQERRRMHQPDGPPTAEASRRSKSSQVNVSGPAAAMMF